MLLTFFPVFLLCFADAAPHAFLSSLTEPGFRVSVDSRGGTTTTPMDPIAPPVWKQVSDTVYDIQGKQQFVPMSEIVGGGQQLFVGGLSSGLYWVEIRAGEQRTTVKLVKP